MANIQIMSASVSDEVKFPITYNRRLKSAPILPPPVAIPLSCYYTTSEMQLPGECSRSWSSWQGDEVTVIQPPQQVASLSSSEREFQSFQWTANALHMLPADILETTGKRKLQDVEEEYIAQIQMVRRRNQHMSRLALRGNYDESPTLMNARSANRGAPKAAMNPSLVCQQANHVTYCVYFDCAHFEWGSAVDAVPLPAPPKKLLDQMQRTTNPSTEVEKSAAPSTAKSAKRRSKNPNSTSVSRSRAKRVTRRDPDLYSGVQSEGYSS